MSVAAGDNTLASAGTGDSIRDIQKGGVAGSKTQVNILDLGGHGTEAIAQVAATNDVYLVTLGTQSSGTFTVSYGGQTTSGQAYNVTSGNLQTAITGLSSVGSGNATVTGSTGGPYTVTLLGTLASVANSAVTCSFASLTTPANASIVQQVTGGPVQPVPVAGLSVTSSQSKTRPANTTTYVVGQVVSESTSAGTTWTFSSCTRITGGSGTISSVRITDGAKQSLLPQFYLYLFKSASSCSQNDAATFAPTKADLDLLACDPIPVFTPFTGSTTCVIQATEIVRQFFCTTGQTQLLGTLVAANAYVPVSGEVLTILLNIAQD